MLLDRWLEVSLLRSENCLNEISNRQKGSRKSAMYIGYYYGYRLASATDIIARSDGCPQGGRQEGVFINLTY